MEKDNSKLEGKSENKCSDCGKIFKSGSTLLVNETCDCRKKSDASIRLGPVPDSAFRPPSPRPPTKEEHNLGLPKDGTKYEIVSIREKHGNFRKAVPCMPMPAAIICCLLNVLLPGTGTLVASFTVFCGCRTEHKTRRSALIYNLGAAILQMITAPLVVGWIWSVLWGITFINVSATKALQDNNVETAAV